MKTRSHSKTSSSIMKQMPTQNPNPVRKVKQASTQTQVSPQVTTQTGAWNDISKNGDIKDDLAQVYSKIKSAPSYSAKISEFLRRYPVHSIHRRKIVKFPRRRVIARFPFELFMADLIEFAQ